MIAVPKCPKCGKEINHLHNVQNAVDEWEFRVVDGRARYDEVHTYPASDDRNDFECPECWELLFKSEEEAIRFLSGQLVPMPEPETT